MPFAFAMVGSHVYFHPAVCGQSFTIKHAMNCPCGGFPSIRHNELCDNTASLLTEIFHAVGTEPCLQPLSGEQLKYKTANDADEAHLDVVAENIGPRTGRRLFYVKVFNPFSKSYANTPLAQGHCRLEQDKRRSYEQSPRR